MPDTINSAEESPSRLFRAGLIYILLFALLFAAYLQFSPAVTLQGSPYDPVAISIPYVGDTGVRTGMALLLTALVSAAILLALFRRLTAGKALGMLIIGGIVMRFGVMLYTPFFIHGHDVGPYNGYGHLAYIFHLYTQGKLPDTNIGQFYHPPLAHLAAAAVARLFAAVTGADQRDVIFESARLAPCFFSCASMLVAQRLFSSLHFSTKAQLFAMTIVAFHPTFFLLSSSINNDMLMVLLFLTAVLYTVRWYKNPTYKNILLLALSIGGAMSAKFSGAFVAVFTASVFMLVLIRQYKNGRSQLIVGQLAAFAAVCFPLGLWYPFRNLKLFGQSLGYVLEIPKESSLYVGTIPLRERFLRFDLFNVLWGGYCRPRSDYRVWEYTVKCALFGEFTFSDKQSILSVVLIAASLVLIILSLGAMVWFCAFDRKKNRLAALSFTGLWLLLTASFVYFNVKFPFGCSMDFRYNVPTVIIGAAFLGLLFDKLSGNRRFKPYAVMLIAVVVVFAISSAAFYII